MELHCNTVTNAQAKLNPNVEEFRPSRPKPTTAAVGKMKIRDIQEEDDAFDHLSNGGSTV